MERIAAEAEVSVGTLYFYFKNKHDILLRLLDDIGFELRDTLGRAFGEADDGFEGLARASRAFFAFCRTRPDRLAIIFRESPGQGEEVERQRKAIFAKLHEDLEEALARVAASRGTTFRSAGSVAVMAAGILGTYERLAYRHFLWSEPNEADTAAVERDAVDFIVGGVERLTR
jgi:AcrR family transcriptional regulator